jgi:hypothetical protein
MAFEHAAIFVAELQRVTALEKIIDPLEEAFVE